MKVIAFVVVIIVAVLGGGGMTTTAAEYANEEPATEGWYAPEESVTFYDTTNNLQVTTGKVYAEKNNYAPTNLTNPVVVEPMSNWSCPDSETRNQIVVLDAIAEAEGC